MTQTGGQKDAFLFNSINRCEIDQDPSLFFYRWPCVGSVVHLGPLVDQGGGKDLITAMELPGVRSKQIVNAALEIC